MGYDLHITRAIDWSCNQGYEITVQEWLGIVTADPELRPFPSLGPYAARFGPGWFDWYEGNVLATDPNHAAVAKMLAIAELLAAAVQGDDGEFYDSAHEWSRGRERR